MIVAFKFVLAFAVMYIRLCTLHIRYGDIILLLEIVDHNTLTVLQWTRKVTCRILHASLVPSNPSKNLV